MDFANYWFSSQDSSSTFEIKNSLRFNGAQYLTRLCTATVNNYESTVSFWMKKAKPTVGNAASDIEYLMEGYYQAGDETIMFLNSAGVPAYGSSDSARCVSIRSSNQIGGTPGSSPLRDPSAWYHVVYLFQTGVSTGTCTVYINGEEVDVLTVTSNNNYPFFPWWCGNPAGGGVAIGRGYGTAAYYFQGFLAEFHCTETVRLPSDFGEYNAQGVWVPKEYTKGGYGVNGFYLNFSDPNDIGRDYSDSTTLIRSFTASGFDFTNPLLDSYDLSFDSPTVNTPIWINLLDPFQNTGFNVAYGWPTSANTKSAGDTSSFAGSDRLSLQIPATGSYDIEFLQSNGNTLNSLAAANGFFTSDDFYSGPGSLTQKVGRTYYYGNAGTTTSAGVWSNGAIIQTGTGFAFAPGGTYRMRVKIDRNADEVIWYQPTTSPYDQPTTPLITYDLDGYESWEEYIWALAGTGSANTSMIFNIQNNDSIDIGLSCVTLPPAPITAGTNGFRALTGAGADILDIAQGTNNSGTNWDPTITTGFTNGMWWIKDLANSGNMQLITSFDTTKAISTPGGLTYTDYVAPSGSSVAYCWETPSTPVTLTDGSITSTVYANPAKGFSIVSYNGVAGYGTTETIAHGLGKAPEFIVTKNLANNTTMPAWAKPMPYGRVVIFTDQRPGFPGNFYGDSNTMDLNSTTYTVESPNSDNEQTTGTTEPRLAYLWTSIPGYSQIGGYIGNGSAVDGPFIYTGFRPAWVMIKNYLGGDHWLVADSTNNTYNLTDEFVSPSDSQPLFTDTNNGIDLLSNGFKIRGNQAPTNKNTETYLYMAFAENPFGGSNVAPVNAR